jgi:hypothetical protein
MGLLNDLARIVSGGAHVSIRVRGQVVEGVRLSVMFEGIDL